MKRILSLDASTTTIGVAVIDYDKIPNLHHYEFYKPNKKLNLFEMLNEVTVYIESLVNLYKPDYIAIEDIIQFMKNNSTAKTTISLAVLNRTIGLTIYKLTRRPPVLLNVLTIRHALKFTKALPKKEEMPEIVAKHLNIEFPYYTKLIKKTGKIKILPESMDVADGVAVGLAFIKKHLNDK